MVTESFMWGQVKVVIWNSLFTLGFHVSWKSFKVFEFKGNILSVTVVVSHWWVKTMMRWVQEFEGRVSHAQLAQLAASKTSSEPIKTHRHSLLHDDAIIQ